MSLTPVSEFVFAQYKLAGLPQALIVGAIFLKCLNDFNAQGHSDL
jgi:hypothetical protein